MTTPSKRSVLRCLGKPRLAMLAERYDVGIVPRSARAKLLDALARASKPTMAELLDELARDELEQVCREHELDDRGRSKAELIARVVAPPTVAARERVSAVVARELQADRQLSLLADATSATVTAVQAPAIPAPAAVDNQAPAPEVRTFKSFSDIASFIWGVADLLRGDYKAHEYGQVILPFTVLRRLDQVLAPTREAVQQADRRYADKPEAVRERFLLRAAGETRFYNTSPFDFAQLAKPGPTAANFKQYVHGFSRNVRDILEHFRFTDQIERLEHSDLLLLVTQRFAAVDLRSGSRTRTWARSSKS